MLPLRQNASLEMTKATRHIMQMYLGQSFNETLLSWINMTMQYSTKKVELGHKVDYTSKFSKTYAHAGRVGTLKVKVTCQVINSKHYGRDGGIEIYNIAVSLPEYSGKHNYHLKQSIDSLTDAVIESKILNF